jgi:methionyl aminopeptidase
MPSYVNGKISPSRKLVIKDEVQITGVRQSCSIAKQLLNSVAKFIRPGISTADIDDFCFDYIISKKAYPSPLGYGGFPAAVCTSVNEVICHGIPSKRYGFTR